MLADLLASAGAAGIDVEAAAAELRLDEDVLRARLDDSNAVRIGPRRAVARAHFDAVCGTVLALLERFHAEHPHERGIAQGTARTQIAPAPDPDLWQAVLTALAADARIEQADRIIALRGFDPFAGFTANERRIAAEIEAAFRRSGIEAPRPCDLLGSTRKHITPLMEHLDAVGFTIRIGDTRQIRAR